MPPKVETFTPANVMTPIGPYSHVARYGDFIMIGGTAGADPETNKLAGPDVAIQTTRILDSLELMLRSVGSDLNHVLHINVLLADMSDFAVMNHAYEARMGDCRPARTAISVSGLPKPGALVTMNLTAVTKQTADKNAD